MKITKIEFLSPLRVEGLRKIDSRSNLTLFILISDFSVKIYMRKGKQEVTRNIVIPSGFITDLASIPKLARWYICPTDSDIMEAAVLHDFLYRYTGGSFFGWVGDERFTRTMSDKILRIGCRSLHMGKTKSWLVFVAVRVFGWASWRRYLKSKSPLPKMIPV